MAAPIPTSRMMTVEEFFALPDTEEKQELVRGELRVTPPAGGPHGVAGANLVFALWLFEGDVLDGGTVIPGFSCAVDVVFEGIARSA